VTVVPKRRNAQCAGSWMTVPPAARCVAVAKALAGKCRLVSIGALTLLRHAGVAALGSSGGELHISCL